jgi:hypothetical protein
LAATIGAALLATVPLISVVGTAPASAVLTDELTASYTEPYPAFSTLTTSSQEFRQTFQATVTGELTRTRIWLRSEFSNYPAGGIPASVSVYNLNADNTLGALVDIGYATITGSAWPAPATDTATFSGAQTLTAGNKYALVVRSQYFGWDSSFYAEMVGGGYPYGRAYVCGVGTESCSTNYWSTWFQVYVSTVPADTTPPVVSVTVAPDPVLQGLTATATFSATDAESDITTTTCASSFAVDTSVAGIFTVSCGATSAGGSSEASYTYTVLSPSQGIADLRDDVVADVPAKMASPLVSLLDGAIKNLGKDDPAGAIDKLTSFISLVSAQADKKIPSDVAMELMADAQMIIDSIDASTP